MGFAADLEQPACYVEVKSVGQLSASQTQAITSDFCTLLGELFGVSAERTYISIHSSRRSPLGLERNNSA